MFGTRLGIGSPRGYHQVGTPAGATGDHPFHDGRFGSEEVKLVPDGGDPFDDAHAYTSGAGVGRRRDQDPGSPAVFGSVAADSRGPGLTLGTQAGGANAMSPASSQLLYAQVAAAAAAELRTPSPEAAGRR